MTDDVGLGRIIESLVHKHGPRSATELAGLIPAEQPIAEVERVCESLFESGRLSRVWASTAKGFALETGQGVWVYGPPHKAA